MGLGPGEEDPDHQGSEEDGEAAADPPMPPGVIRIGGGNPDNARVAADEADEANAQGANPQLAASMMQVCNIRHQKSLL